MLSSSWIVIINTINYNENSIYYLILEELLPIARAGLESRKVDSDDIDLYLGIIEERAKAHSNGARWLLRSYTKLAKESTKDEALSVITNTLLKNQKSDVPVHKWKMPELKDLESYHPTDISVSEFMTTDLVTVQKDDIVDLVAQMMNWKGLRYTLVEDKKGNIVGLVTSKKLLFYYYNLKVSDDNKAFSVEDIMIPNPITISPNSSIKTAMNLMKDNNIGCLPVVSNSNLVGIVTETDLLRISSRLLERMEH